MRTEDSTRPNGLEDPEFRRLCLSTRQDRERLVADAERLVYLNLERQGRLGEFLAACRDSIVGAAMLLGRDPEELAEHLRDGRLAWYIRDGEAPLRLELDDTDPGEPIETALRTAAEWADTERDRVERQMTAITGDLARLAEELRGRVRRIEFAPLSWATFRERHKQGAELRRLRAGQVQPHVVDAAGARSRTVEAEPVPPTDLPERGRT
jgi:hypothetical protein